VAGPTLEGGRRKVRLLPRAAAALHAQADVVTCLPVGSLPVGMGRDCAVVPARSQCLSPASLLLPAFSRQRRGCLALMLPSAAHAVLSLRCGTSINAPNLIFTCIKHVPTFCSPSNACLLGHLSSAIYLS